VAQACSKPTPDVTGAQPSAAAVATTASAAPSASASAGGDAAATGNAPAESWTGKYTSTAGSLFVPDGGEWSNTKWRGDPSTDGLGEGTLTLEIAGPRVTGTLEGPLGPAVVRGAVAGGQITAWIERTTPSDKGFSGTLAGTASGATLEGTMHLSVYDAHVIREARFTLARRAK
jgi:hypothetical protein